MILACINNPDIPYLRLAGSLCKCSRWTAATPTSPFTGISMRPRVSKSCRHLGIGVSIVMVVVAATASAQDVGAIRGTVQDTSGAVLPGVTITATSPSALGAQTTVTSETGNYRFPAIPPGVYCVCGCNGSTKRRSPR